MKKFTEPGKTSKNLHKKNETLLNHPIFNGKHPKISNVLVLLHPIKQLLSSLLPSQMRQFFILMLFLDSGCHRRIHIRGKDHSGTDASLVFNLLFYGLTDQILNEIKFLLKDYHHYYHLEVLFKRKLYPILLDYSFFE